MIKVLLGYIGLINLLAFIIFGIDKYKASNDQWRISERNLIVLSLLGGWVGAVMGMSIFHHKTIKRSFLVKFLVCILSWLIVGGAIIYFII